MEDILLPNRVGELPSPLPAARGACCVSNYLPYAPLRIKITPRLLHKGVKQHNHHDNL